MEAGFMNELYFAKRKPDWWKYFCLNVSWIGKAILYLLQAGLMRTFLLTRSCIHDRILAYVAYKLRSLIRPIQTGYVKRMLLKWKLHWWENSWPSS